MSLQEVAKKAGVSVATVSRVVNNRPGVARDKVDRVRKAVEALDFVPKTRISRSVPSIAPKGLKYGAVAVLVMGEGHIGAAELFVRQLEPICKGLAVSGISPVVCMGATCLEEMPPVLQKKMIDGILLFGERNDELLQFFEGIPVFWMTSHHEGARAVILPGNREIGELGAEYCRSKACRHVVAINPDRKLEVHESRCLAFVEAAQGFGIEAVCLKSDAPAGRILEGVRNLIDLNQAVILSADALFFPSDRLCAYSHEALHALGVWGKDSGPLLLTCGGEKNYLAGIFPKPVSIDMCADLIGQQAVEQVLWRIRNPGEKRRFSVVIHPELID